MEDEDWELWEKFGMYHLAMKINSFKLLGYKTITFDRLHKGALIEDSIKDIEFIINEVAVIRSMTEMTPNISSKLLSFKKNEPFTWIEGNYIVQNAPNGKAIDFWSCHQILDGRILIDVDQRKDISDKIGTKGLDKYVKWALEVIPEQIGKKVVKVVGIFPGKSEPAQKMVLPQQSYLVTKKESTKYHGIFATYPPANPYFSINNPSLLQTTIKSSMRGKDSGKLSQIATAILLERDKNGLFKTKKDLYNRVKELEGVVFSEFLMFED